MESSLASDYHEKLQLNGSENFLGELQITLQLGSRWAFEASYFVIAHHQKASPVSFLVLRRSFWTSQANVEQITVILNGGGGEWGEYFWQLNGQFLQISELWMVYQPN